MDGKEKLKFELLSNILILTDLHSENYGIDGEGNLSIVDFQVFLNLFLLTFFTSDITKKIFPIKKYFHLKSLIHSFFI